MAAHALLSPSSAHRWRSCTASPSQSMGKPNESSPAAMQGTAEHQVSEECLKDNLDPMDYIGRTMVFYRDANGVQQETWTQGEAIAGEFHRVVIDEDSAARCMAYIQFVRDLVKARNATLFVEQRVQIDHITGEAGARGTSDAVLLAGDELIICDAKFGRNKVVAYYEVKPATYDAEGRVVEPAVYEPNDQLAMYADGSLREFEWMGEFKTVRMIIVQPAINHVSEFAYSIEQHRAFIERVRADAQATRTNPVYRPSNDNCFFCPGRFDCPERNKAAMELAAAAFEDPDQAPAAAIERTTADRHLGTIYSKVPFIRKWLDDIEQRVQSALDAGFQVLRDDGKQYALGAPKEGPRKWDDEAAIEEVLSKMRLGDAMYERKVISPTTAEKLTKVPKNAPEGAKPLLGPRQWNKLAAHITREPGKAPIVVIDGPAQPAATDSSTDLFS